MHGLTTRLLQLLAMHAPVSSGVRVRLRRLRGIRIGRGVFIRSEVLLDTSPPELICIGERVTSSMRTTVIAHARQGTPAERGARCSVVLESDAFVAPARVILAGVMIGEAAVVAAGSVGTANVQPRTVAQGNPARPVARTGIPLSEQISMQEFTRQLRPIG